MNRSTGTLNCTWKQFAQMCNKTKLPTNSCTFPAGESTEKQTLECSRWTWQWVRSQAASRVFTYDGLLCLFIDWPGGNRKTPAECFARVCLHSCWARTETATRQSYLLTQGITCATGFWLERHFESSGEIKKLRLHLYLQQSDSFAE